MRFLYEEMGAEEAESFRHTLEADLQLMQEYRRLLQTRHMMPDISFSPGADAVARILAHAAKKKTQEQSS